MPKRILAIDPGTRFLGYAALATVALGLWAWWQKNKVEEKLFVVEERLVVVEKEKEDVEKEKEVTESSGSNPILLIAGRK